MAAVRRDSPRIVDPDWGLSQKISPIPKRERGIPRKAIRMRERPIKSNTIASMKHCLKGDVSLCLRQDKGTRNLLNMSEIIQTLKERGFLKTS
jgi:hypothetical protein